MFPQGRDDPQCNVQKYIRVIQGHQATIVIIESHHQFDKPLAAKGVPNRKEKLQLDSLIGIDDVLLFLF